MKGVLLASCVGCACNSAEHPGITMLDHAPAGALDLDVRVYRWACQVTDPDGTQDSDLHVPVGRAIRLTIHDDDRVKLDVELVDEVHVARGAPVTLAFRVDRPGTYDWKCPVQQPPGNHTNPPAHMVATTAEQYAAYQAVHREDTNPKTTEGKIALGKQLYQKKGCVACHSIDGSPRVGISLAKLWGTTATLIDGSSRVVDAAFITDSLNEPMRIRRDGYPPAMPSFEGQLRPAELVAFAAYIESLL